MADSVVMAAPVDETGQQIQVSCRREQSKPKGSPAAPELDLVTGAGKVHSQPGQSMP